MNTDGFEDLTKQEKVYRLTVELLEVQRQIKEFVTPLREEIKDLKSEIKALTEEE